MALLFNKTMKNILSNYIPHEMIICDDRHPPWMNNRIKELINEKNDSNKAPKLFNKAEYLQNELKSLIESNKKSITHVSRKEL